MQRISLVLAPLCALLLPAAALAQTPPDAGSLLRQTAPRGEPPAARTDSPLRDASAAPARPAGGAARVRVQRFAIEANNRFTDAQLQPRLAPWVGRELSLAELRQAAASVCAAYAEAGWLAHCDLPPQDVTEGVIRIRVLEARLGGVRVQGSPQRIAPAHAESLLLAAQPQGQPLSLPAVERAVLLVSDLPGVSAQAALAAGSTEGETLVLLKLDDRAVFGGDLVLDNGGSRSTGQARASATLRLDGPLALGDAWTAQALHSRGNDYLRLGASLPVGLSGLRMGVSASGLRYRLLGDELAALGGRGTAGTLGLDAAYPLLRSRGRNLELRMSARRDRFDNQASGSTTSRYRSHSISLTLNANQLDDWGGGGASAASLQLSRGRIDLDGSPNQAADAAGPAVQGRFDKASLALNRQQALTRWLSAIGSFAAQWAGKNLDSSERFYLGGPGGVRAYPASEGGGSRGQLANLELRAQLPANFVLGGFYDWGQVQALVRGPITGSGPNRYRLKGAGLSLAWSGPRALSLRATWARRIGANPNPTSTGTDQDGSLTRNRLWLQAGLPL